MKAILLKLNCLFFSLFFVTGTFAQTQTASYNVPFSSGMQNMWGPSWNAFSLNINKNLFDVPWNETFDSGNSGIVSILGAQFGASIQGTFSGVFGANFSLTGFTTGEVEVDYPIDVDFVMSDDYSYDQGDVVTVNTDYSVTSGYALNSYYPSAGEAKFDLYFRLAGNLSATLCAFGCATFPVIPNFDTGIQTINIFTINTSGVDFFSYNGSTPLYSYPGFPLKSDMIPNDPLGEYGVSAWLGLPYVITTDNLSGTDLSACGDSTYANLNVNVFDLIGAMHIPYVSAVAANLAGEESFGPGTVHWNFFDASFDVNVVNNQCFDFKPKVYSQFEFPTPVDYSVYNTSGSLVTQGTSAIIDVLLGNQLSYKYPCYYEKMDITPTFSIDGQFTNHTYDEITFDFLMSAFEFGVEVPEIEITPSIPSWCFDIGYPCGWFDWCTEEICTPEIPAVVFPGIDLNFGPLWSTSIPLGSVSYDWFNETWALEGFDEYTMSPFTMKANVLSTDVIPTDILCYGDTTGAIDLSVNAISDALPYSYTWTTGAATEDISGVSAGSHQVQVEDSHGCKLFDGAVLTEPGQPVSTTYSKIDKLCGSGANNGSISVAVSGGTSPYFYNWNTGQSTEDIAGLSVGSYVLTVTDNNGCLDTINVVIDEPILLEQSAIVQPLACNGVGTGSIQAVASGGTLPYQYTWSSGQTTSYVNNLSAGNYLLTVTDANGCSSNMTYMVSQPATALSLNAITTNVLCKGDATGSIDISTFGGTSGYTYSWSNMSGENIPIQSEDISSLTAGTYTLIATDQNGCRTQISQTITEPVASIQTTPMLIDVNCKGDATGQISPAISGGTPGYIYNWSTGSGASSLTNIPSGNYTLNLTDANGCFSVFNYELVEPDSAVSIALNSMNVDCYGDTSGAIQSTVLGGTAPYAYNWSNGETLENISNIGVGSYTLTITDNKGCLENAAVLISQPVAPITAASAVTNINCYGDNTGEINLNVNGGTSSYQYQWSNEDSVILSQTTPIVSGLPKGVYTALITDANGCKLIYDTSLTQPAAPLSLIKTIDDVNCYGMPVGSINITLSGGSIGYNYLWSNGATSEDLSSITAGNYSITVTDSQGCIYMDSFYVAQPDKALIASIATTPVKCSGGNNGIINSSVVGGTNPYVYNWSNGDTTQNLIGVVAGTYSLTVTDAQGCTAFTGTTLGEPLLPLVVTPAITNVQCYGGKDGEVKITMSGGTPPYTYNWGDQNEILLNHFSETITGLNVGEYFIRVIDKNGCVNEQYLTINQPQAVVITDSITNVLCYGDSTGAIDLSIMGGTPNYTYLWSDGQITQDALNLNGGNHSVTVTDAHSCVYQDTVFVYQPEKVEIGYQIQPLSCMDQSDAAIFIAPYGGESPYIFSWNNGANTQDIEALKAGHYSLILTDNNGCASNYPFVINTSDVRCVQIPNTITPNGDNYNDTWIIENIYLYPNAVVKVFNKWGSLVYNSPRPYQPWRGTYNGNPLPSGVYYYVIALGNKQGDEYNGTITIIR